MAVDPVRQRAEQLVEQLVSDYWALGKSVNGKPAHHIAMTTRIEAALRAERTVTLQLALKFIHPGSHHLVLRAIEASEQDGGG